MSRTVLASLSFLNYVAIYFATCKHQLLLLRFDCTLAHIASGAKEFVQIREEYLILRRQLYLTSNRVADQTSSCSMFLTLKAAVLCYDNCSFPT